MTYSFPAKIKFRLLENPPANIVSLLYNIIRKYLKMIYTNFMNNIKVKINHQRQGKQCI
jgi:hypothetical protein